MAEQIEEAEVVSSDLERRSVSIATADELSVDQVMAQVHKIQAVMQQAMKNGEHYGVIPGTNKPTLLKPGAEKLCLTFRLAPKPEVHETWHDDGHYTVRAVMTLSHIPTGNFVAAGEGLCSTREAKYAWRKGERTCPNCQSNAIIKGKAEYGGGWLCWKNKGGCGTKWQDGDATIEGQNVEKVPNPDIADSYNTVLKMACKRALVAAVLNGTAASDIFTQDIGDDSDPHSSEGGSPRTGNGDAHQQAEAAPTPPPSTTRKRSPDLKPDQVSKAQSSSEEPKAASKEPRAEKPQAASTPSPPEEAAGVGGEVGSEPSSGDPYAVIAQAIADKRTTATKVTSKAARIATSLMTEGVIDTMPTISSKTLIDVPDEILERVVQELNLQQEVMTG